MFHIVGFYSFVFVFLIILTPASTTEFGTGTGAGFGTSYHTRRVAAEGAVLKGCQVSDPWGHGTWKHTAQAAKCRTEIRGNYFAQILIAVA